MIKSEINVVPIFEEIKDLIVSSRKSIYSIVNIEMLSLYWKIGKIIMGIQYGEKRAKYGDYVLKELSVKLTSEFGRGFSERNLRSMRKFYLLFPNWKTVSSELSWSHYI